MHDHARQLETESGEPRGPIWRRQTERSDASDAVVASGPQHGPGMANPAEPPARNGERQIGSAADVESVRSTRCSHCSDDGRPRSEERLAALGVTAGQRRQPLHPEASTPTVIDAKPTGPVSTENVLQLLKFQEHRCALTGRQLTPDLASLDHVIPIRIGGEHAIENTQVLHRDVNRAKGTLTNDEFLQLCSEVVAHALGSHLSAAHPHEQSHIRTELA